MLNVSLKTIFDGNIPGDHFDIRVHLRCYSAFIHNIFHSEESNYLTRERKVSFRHSCYSPANIVVIPDIPVILQQILLLSQTILKTLRNLFLICSVIAWERIKNLSKHSEDM